MWPNYNFFSSTSIFFSSSKLNAWYLSNSLMFEGWLNGLFFLVDVRNSSFLKNKLSFATFYDDIFSWPKLNTIFAISYSSLASTFLILLNTWDGKNKFVLCDIFVFCILLFIVIVNSFDVSVICLVALFFKRLFQFPLLLVWFLRSVIVRLIWWLAEFPSIPKHYPKILISIGKWSKTLILKIYANFFLIKGLNFILKVYSVRALST